MMNCQAVKSAIDAQPNAVGSMAHLDHCAECRAYATEMTSLLQLLRQQPRIEVPANYDFQLRARIARAESAPANRPFALLFGLFSAVSGRAASAAAVLVLAVGVSFYYSGEQSPLVSPSESAELALQDSSRGPQSSELVAAVVEKGDGAISPEPSASRAVTRSLAARSAFPDTDLSTATDMEQSPEMVAFAPASAETPGEGAWRVYSLERREMISSSLQTTLIGAELSLKDPRSGTKEVPFVPSI